MKTKIGIYLCCLFLLFGTTACAPYFRSSSKPHKAKTIPPGQAKKIMGSKSAKPFAPGQHKK